MSTPLARLGRVMPGGPVKDKPDHLIERAAALLRTGNMARVPDHAGLPADPVPTAPERPAVALAPPPPTMAPAAAQASSVADPPLAEAPRISLPLRPPAAPPPEPVAPGSVSANVPSAPVVTLEAMERAGLVVARTKRTRISEEYRIVIGRVLRAMHDQAGGEGLRNLLLVTSARPGEGKSFTTLNLAASIAQNTQETVLLVDVDSKPKPISALLGLGDRPGFLDLVADPARRPDDVVLQTAVPNLSVIPVGSREHVQVPQPDGRNASLSAPTITRLARRYPKSLVMLDAPPCLSTSDPHTIAPLVGQVVMVVEAERTQRPELESALDLVRSCPNITLLLNKVRLTTSHTFGAYDYYGAYV